jgi:hypothetical protein
LDALSDEKIISQLQATLITTECPVSRRAFSSLAGAKKTRQTEGL